MYIYCAIVLAIFITYSAACLINHSDLRQHQLRMPSADALKTDEVAKLIHRINEDDAGDDAALRDEFNAYQGKPQTIDLDYIGIRATNENPSLARLLDLIKSLKEKGTHYHNDDVRLHVIQNPHVLQEYKEQLAKKHGSLISSSSSSSSDETAFKLRLSNLLRRNAVFRLDRTETEYNEIKPALRTGGSEWDLKKNSMEKDDKIDKSHVTFKDNNDEYAKDKKQFIDTSSRKKDNYKDNKKDEWDTVVQKYDKWNNKNNDFVKKTKYNEDSRNNDKYKDERNRNDKYKDETHRDDKYNDDRKRNDNYNDETKRKDKYNDETTKRDKYKDGYNDHRWNDNGSPKKKSGDDWDRPQETKSFNSKKDNWDEPKDTKSYNSKKDNWDEPKESKSYNSKKDNWDDPKESKSYNSKKDNWDEPKESKSYNSKKDNWDEPKKTINSKKDDSWDSWKSKSMEKAGKDRNKQKNDDWDKPVKKDDMDRGSYERKKDDSFKDKPSYDIPAYKENRESSGWNKKFVPKISEYYNKRPRNQDHERPGFKPFGRTSIPFVGKKGIYEEEVVK